MRRHIFPLLLIVAVTLVTSLPYVNEPPAYIHAWAQADNYSLSLGFLHNGGDLFHPQTLIYNKQQKGFDDPVTTVTACDLPLHHWLVAGLMKLLGTHQPWVFRCFTLLVAILGMWSLYLLAFVLSRSRAKSLLVTVFTATAPSFAYYSASFLPTLPAISLSLGGLLCYALYWRDDKLWALYVSLLLLTLAMMTRTSFAVLWVAVACFHLLRVIRHEVTLRTSWLPFVSGAFLFAAWWLWSLHLRQQYGSLFLGSLLPVHSMADALNVWQNVHDRWQFHYFQRMQHWLFVVVLLGAIITLIIKRKNVREDGQNAAEKLSPWWLLAIWFFGELLFVVAMLQQYCDHDYYFLDSLFLPIVMLLLGLMSIWPNPSKRGISIAVLAIVLILSVFMTVKAMDMQKVRRQEGAGAYQTALRYQKANQMLEEYGYGDQNLRFLTMFSYPQNLPFVMMDREGYSVMWTKEKIVEHALTFDYDYILVEDAIYRYEFDNAPYVLPYLRRLAGNGEISVCVLSDTLLHPTADHFFEP